MACAWIGYIELVTGPQKHRLLGCTYVTDFTPRSLARVGAWKGIKMPGIKSGSDRNLMKVRMMAEDVRGAADESPRRSGIRHHGPKVGFEEK